MQAKGMKMITRIAVRFLSRLASASVPLNPTGTVQIKNLVAKYNVREFDGRLSNCRFRIQFDIFGKQFMLSGLVKDGRVKLNFAYGPGMAPIPPSEFHGVARKHFVVDPELWIKRALENALVSSVGPGDMDRWIVVNDEVIDSDFLTEDKLVVSPSVPMSQAV